MSYPTGLTFAQCLVAGMALILPALWFVLRLYVLPSSLDNIPGPRRSSFFLGNLNDFFDRNGWGFQDMLSKKYGPVVKINGMLGEKLLYVYDPKALQSILSRDQSSYDEPSWFLASNNLVFGPGLLATRGNVHKKQRNMLNPAFSTSHMRRLTPVLYRVSHKLRETLETKLKGPKEEVDMLNWLNRTALELIGQGGIGYSFDPGFEDKSNAYGDALKSLLPALSKLSVLRTVSEHVGKLGSARFRRLLAERVPNTDFQQLKYVIDTMDARTRAIFREKKAAMQGGDEGELQQLGDGKDILSILMRANMEADEDAKLSEEELIAQMSTLVFAATDTTASAASRILQVLADHPDAQQKLRDELRKSKQEADFTYDELYALPYLDAVIRETLRLYPPVTSSFRAAQRETVLPFSGPIRGLDGSTLMSVHVPKNTTVIVGIRGANKHEDIWGTDSGEWKPERWLGHQSKAEQDARLPGVYSNQMSFLGGSRACVGFRLAELDIKVLLSVLIPAFKFSPTKKSVVWNLAFVVYPTVDWKSMKASLPLVVEKMSKLTL